MSIIQQYVDLGKVELASPGSSKGEVQGRKAEALGMVSFAAILADRTLKYRNIARVSRIKKVGAQRNTPLMGSLKRKRGSQRNWAKQAQMEKHRSVG